jgi:hypothetical protein
MRRFQSIQSNALSRRKRFSSKLLLSEPITEELEEITPSQEEEL